jgi:hypothetical protein
MRECSPFSMSPLGAMGKGTLGTLCCLAAILSTKSALACSVCYGDPDALMTKGIQAGVLILLGVVGTVLTGVASLLLFWIRRATNLERQSRSLDRAAI